MSGDSVSFRQWLDKQVRILPPGSRLPTDREMAQAHGLSERSVWAVLREYRSAGKVERIRGKGTFIPGAEQLPPRNHQRISQHGSLEVALYRAVATGQFRSGEPLPSVKFLCSHFHVSPGTVRQAFDALARREIISRIGKRFWVGDLSERLQGTGAKPVHLFMWDSDDFGRLFAHPRDGLRYHAMETELLKYGYRVCFESSRRFEHLSRHWLRTREYPYGIILLDLNDRRWERIGAAVRSYARHAGAATTRVVLGTASRLRGSRPSGAAYYSTGAIFTSVCRELARHIVERRYTRVTVFHDESIRDLGFILALAKLRAELHQLAGEIPFRVQVCGDGRRLTVDELIGKYRDGPDRRHMENILSKYRPTGIDELERQVGTVHSFEPLWCTAQPGELWVCLDCRQADRALTIATKNGIQVPSEAAIISLRDDPALCHRGISCCIRDDHHAGYALAHTVIGDIPIEKTSQGFIRMRARLLLRGTT